MISSKPNKLILIGASTGGPGLIERIVTALDVLNGVSIVIAQHMDRLSLASFAKRLHRIYPEEVVLVSDRLPIQSGRIYVIHDTATIHYKHNAFILEMQSMQESYYHPTIDLLFDSAAMLHNIKISAYLLSGIGADGAAGMFELQERGFKTVAQDELSSIVYGMPKRALEMGAAQQVLSIDEIIRDIQQEVYENVCTI